MTHIDAQLAKGNAFSNICRQDPICPSPSLWNIAQQLSIDGTSNVFGVYRVNMLHSMQPAKRLQIQTIDKN